MNYIFHSNSSCLVLNLLIKCLLIKEINVSYLGHSLNFKL